MVRERVVAASPLATAGGRVIAAPFQFYVDGSDHLRVEGWNSKSGVTLQVFGRFLDAEGNVDAFAFTLALTSDRARASRDYALARGSLLNLVVTAVGASPAIGQTFARVTVIRGFSGATIVLGTMLQGYVTAQQGLGWPGSPIENSISGGGYQRTILGTTPAPGLVVQETVPTGARWELRTCGAELNTDATVVTRYPFFLIAFGASQVYLSPHPDTLGASLVRNMHWGAGMPFEALIGGWGAFAALVNPSILLAADVFRINALNFQIGDQWQDVIYQVREWLEVE